MEIGILRDWADSIAIHNCRIVKFPSLIFLCGGRISYNNDNFLSFRDYFYNYIKSNKSPFFKNVILAEEIFSYFEHSKYNDLLCFERDLAELSILTVIFSESPGSIAEFGSFAMLDQVQDRLLVVMRKKDTYKENFIWRGPALFLKSLAQRNGKADPISIYDWQEKNICEEKYTEQDFSDAQDLIEIIIKCTSDVPKTAGVNITNKGHSIILIPELLKVVHLATHDELVFLLNSLGIGNDKSTVEQHLSLLISLKYVERRPYSNNIYYHSSKNDIGVKWAFLKEANNRDLERWKNLFIEYYRDNQPTKHRALRSYLKSRRQIGD